MPFFKRAGKPEGETPAPKTELEQLHEAAEELKHPDSDVRRKAIKKLEKIKLKSAVTCLTDALHDQDWGVRLVAATALSDRQDPRTVHHLVLALFDNQPIVKFHAAEALGKIRHEDAIQHLVKLVQEERAGTAEVEALGNMGHESVISHLVQALYEPAEVRKAAEKALVELRPMSAIPHLEKILRQEPDFEKPPLKDIDHELGLSAKCTAADILGEIGHESALPVLIQTLRRDSRADIRMHVATALGKIGHESAVPHLIKALQLDPDWEVMMHAAEALGKIGHESAIPYLVKALKAPEQAMRGTTADSLVKIGWNIQKKEVKGKEAKALQLMGAYFHEEEEAETIRKAYETALAGKVTKKNARLYVKQLRAVKGKLK